MRHRPSTTRIMTPQPTVKPAHRAAYCVDTDWTWISCAGETDLSAGLSLEWLLALFKGKPGARA